MSNKIDFNLLIKLAGLLGLLFIILPVAILIPMSLGSSKYLQFPPHDLTLHWYRHFLASPEWRIPFFKSTLIAGFSAALAVIGGLLAAMGIRAYTGRWKTALMLLLLSPVFLPPIILGVGLLFTFSKLGLFDSYTGIILAHTLLGVPFALVIILSALNDRIDELMAAASSYGASGPFAVLTILVPEIRKQLLNAWLVCFLVSFDEPVLSLFITGTATKTLPRQLFDSVRYDLDPTSAAVAALMILISSILALLFSKQPKS
jgi:ABC-type spermidine/putrescine transport system permease subunit II